MTAMVLLSEWQRSQVEFWRPINGFPGYDVSSNGRVGSWWTIGPGKGNRKGDGTFGSGGYVIGSLRRVLSQHFDKRGYARVGIWQRGAVNPSVITVHRLVAIAFRCNEQNKPQVNHLNAVRMDNRLDNLQWATRSENIRHAYAAGLFDNAIRRGEANHLTRYSDDQVRGIKKLYALGATKYLIAQATGINAGTISKFVDGKSRSEKE